MGWQDRQSQCAGSVLFRGSLPPRADDFAFLKAQGVSITSTEAGEGTHWMLELEHPQWGKATVICLRNAPRLPQLMIDLDPLLTEEERDLARLGESTVAIMVEGTRGNVLRDRKNLFRFQRALMGDDGVAAVDHTAQRIWSRAALDDELAHDADLDVESLYVLHVVTEDREEGGDEDPVPLWMHSHGLAEIGFFDFDILRPHEDLAGRAMDLTRAIAFGIVEGRVKPNTAKFPLAAPGGDVRFVDVRDFNRRADKAMAALRLDADEEHNKDRAVICEPVSGLLGRWFGRVRPSRFLSEPDDEQMIVHFSDEASDLMAQRARSTYAQFAELAAEFAEFECTPIVKLGYPVDGGDGSQREHLWFEVHELGEDKVDATLINEPYHIAAMQAGQRQWHDINRLTDWTLITPAGAINPRNTRPARLIRPRREELLAAVKKWKAEQTEA